MTLQRVNDETLNLKTGQTVVHIKTNGHIKVNDYSIEGPGEYDIAGVGLHVFEHFAVLFTEGLRLALIWEGEGKIDFEEDANLDVFVLLLTNTQNITTVMKEQDPRIVILQNQAAAQALQSQDGITITEESNYKITPQSLPAGESVFVLLT